MAVIKKYDMDLLRYMSLFEKTCKINSKDCVVIGDTVFFITPLNKAGLAVGKQGVNIQILRKSLERNVRIIEEADNVCKLVENALFPARPANVKQEGNIINIQFVKPVQRRHLLDNKQAELKLLLNFIKYYYPDVAEIKIL